MGRIFISYRRQDSIGIAGRIFDKLTAHFGPADVYLDIDIIPPGADFIKHINDGMAEAQIVLALIGEGWLQARGPKGRRLDDPQDFVRIELELAFARNITVIPVLLGSATMPRAEKLPESIAGITNLNASHVDLGRDFHPHVERLIQYLARHLNGGNSVSEKKLPGETVDSVVDRFLTEADAQIMVSAEHTLIVRPKTELVGFKNRINQFYRIEQADGKKRPLIWVLDFGRQIFDDIDARMRFLNVQALISRFKALKYFEDDRGIERWQWLQSRAVIVLFDPRRDGPQGERIQRPTFAAHNISLTTLDSLWWSSEQFGLLYQNDEEQMRPGTFSIFFNASCDWSSKTEWETSEFRYFGYSQFATDLKRTDLHTRGIELPPLPRIYVDAYKAVCAACAHALNLEILPKKQLPNGVAATQQLRYLGYHILNINEFMERY